MGDKIRLNLNITTMMHDALTARARLRGITRAEFVRRAIERSLGNVFQEAIERGLFLLSQRSPGKEAP